MPKKTSYPLDWPDIDTAVYDRSVRLFRLVKKTLGVKIKLHADSQPDEGNIFLFNHFSRFETFIPQYLIYERTGAYSCAIAAGEFFKTDTALSRYLQKVGVYPHDHPRLFPMLAAQILRGRKVIVFPEGGMVKDRRVMDQQGNFSVYSRITGERRKHHTGAAVLAQGLEAFKTAVRNAYRDKNFGQLLFWKEQLKFENLDELLIAVLKPTLIVPANITFYPIRSSENALQQGVELFSKKLTPRQAEEVLIEGNILLKDTDMDVHMGKPVDPCQAWHWWNRYVLDLFASDLTTLDDVFALHSAPENLKQRVLGRYFRKCAAATRNLYMAEIYANLTVNLSHLASSLIMHCIGEGQNQIDQQRFYTTLYLAIRRLQKKTGINLHRSLVDPYEYIDLIDGKSQRFEQFICNAKENGLISEKADHYRFLEKLRADYDIDAVRLENLIAVYANEAAPLSEVREILVEALAEFDELDPRQLAAWRLEDELNALDWEKKHYSASKYDDINRLESADADPSPFFLLPKHPNGVGVLLIHGLLASPAEARDYGEHLFEQGYTVLGIRVRGHGTSPYALREQSWEDWYTSVRRGFNILRTYCRRIIPVGFSTGGALALKVAAECCSETIGVVALAVPVKLIDPAFMLVPLVHGTNRLVGWLSSYEGVKAFIENVAEHPRVNYKNTPVRGLYELRRLIEAMDEFLPLIDVPSLVVYADKDPVVSVRSAQILMDKLGGTNKKLKIIPAKRHGILMENVGGSWKVIDDFLDEARAHPAASVRHGPCFTPLLPATAGVPCD
ncbi:MAG TPA: alpha/beta fold hydrolase [Methylococcaceae bacterium]|nr:alpha/beta fold hydrolase [Methylococcaceae bacterium]